jgi:hypothetical protein
MHDRGEISDIVRVLRFVSWVLVLIDVSIYDRCCHTMGRSLDASTLMIFPLLNGVSETATFFAVFKVGEQLAKVCGSFSRVPSFLAGFVPYYTFVALIHALMWIRILPDHLSDEPRVRFYRRLMIPSKSLVAATWALLYFFSHDLWNVILQHVVVDCALVMSLHYSMWS